MPRGMPMAWLIPGLVAFATAAVCPAAEESAAVTAASAAYVKAFNDRDFAALGEQWIERAELVEGGTRVVGREAIVASIQGWLQRHEHASLAIEVERVELLAATLARVEGTMLFRRHADDRPVRSRFESLRTLEDGAWRLVESTVAPAHAAALDDLEWLVGTWQAHDEASGRDVETTFERQLDGYLLVGRTRMRSAGNAEIESVTVIAADRDAGVVRSWVFDSTGAQAAGLVSFDGMTLQQTLSGTPSDAVPGGSVQWVQLVVPTGDGRFTQQSVDRSIDGEPVADTAPLHFRRVGDRR